MILLSVLVISTTISANDNVIGRYKSFTALFPKDYVCSDTIDVNVKSKSKKAFKKKQKDFTNIVALVRTVVAIRCPKATKVNLIGLHRKKEVFKTSISKNNKWKLVLADDKNNKNVSQPQYTTTDYIKEGYEFKKERFNQAQTNRKNDLLHYGYSATWLEHVGDNFKIYSAMTGADVDLKTSRLHLVMVHNLEKGENIFNKYQIIRGREVGDFIVTLNDDQVAAIEKVINSLKLGNYQSYYDRDYKDFKGNYHSVGISHFVEGEKSLRPVIYQSVKYNHLVKNKSIEANTKVKTVAGSSLHWVSVQGESVKTDKQVIGNPLADKGFFSARLVDQGDGYKAYVAKIQRKGYESVLFPAIVIVHSNKSIEDTIVAQEEVQPGWFKYTKDYADFIIGLANSSFKEGDFIKDYKKDFSVYHFLKNIPLKKVDHDEIARPYIFASFRHYTKPKPHYAYRAKERHKKTPSSFLELAQQDHALEKNIALEKKAQENQPSLAKKNSLSKQANIERANLYGYVYKDDSYWQEYRTWRAKKLSKKLQKRFRGKQPDIANYLNGEVQTNLRHDGKLAWPLLRFIENTADQCPQNLPKDYVVAEVVTTKTRTWRNRYGPDSVRTSEERRSVKMSKRFSLLYDRYFRVLQNDKASRADNFAINALNNLSNTSISDIADFSTILQEPMWAVDWMFDKEGCDSKVLVQLGENMARLGEGKPSVQSEGLAYNGTRKASGASKKLAATNLLYEEYKSGVLTLTYSSLSNKWVPNIDQMVKHAKTNYPLTFRFRGGDEAPIKIKAKVSNVVGNNSLNALDMAVAGEWTGQLDSDLYEFYSNGAAHADPVFAKMLGQRSPRLRIVQCYYQNGSYYPFWYKSSPTAAEYKNAPSSHIFKAIQPPRKNCPETYDGPHNTFGHLKPAGSTTGSESGRFH